MTDIYFNSQANLQTAVSEDVLGAESNTPVGISFSSLLSIEDTGLGSIVSLGIIGDFNSVANLNSSAQSSLNAERKFNSTSNIYSNTNDISIFKSFSSNVNIVSETNIPLIFYNISSVKKLEYLTDRFTSNHIEHYYPKFKDLIRVFLRYLDYNSIFKTLTLTKNNNLNTIFPEFLDYYLNQYLNEVIDLNKYDLKESNKQLFLLLSRILNNSKGNKKAFSYLFRSLTDIIIANEDITLSIDKIITEFVEDESWWSSSKPFTYQFKIDQSRETMLPLVRAVHPAGFQQEFLFEMNFDDINNIGEVLRTEITYNHYYSAGEYYVLGVSDEDTLGIGNDGELSVNDVGESDTTVYYYDGTIDHSGSHTLIIED